MPFVRIVDFPLNAAVYHPTALLRTSNPLSTLSDSHPSHWHHHMSTRVECHDESLTQGLATLLTCTGFCFRAPQDNAKLSSWIPFDSEDLGVSDLSGSKCPGILRIRREVRKPHSILIKELTSFDRMAKATIALILLGVVSCSAYVTSPMMARLDSANFSACIWPVTPSAILLLHDFPVLLCALLLARIWGVVAFQRSRRYRIMNLLYIWILGCCQPLKASNGVDRNMPGDRDSIRDLTYSVVFSAL